MAMDLAFDEYGISDTGRVRDLNEDRYLSRPLPRGGIWLVADGMGGHDAGEVASGLIAEKMQTIGIPTSISDMHARVTARLYRANAELIDYSQSHGGGIVGSTFVGLLIHDRDYRCLWAGDSRLYLIRNGRLQQISRDHSEVMELVDKGILTLDEAMKSPRRNVITRAVGAHPDIKVDAVYGRIEPEDCFVLCSDGLTAHCSDDDILRAAQGRSAKDAARMLVDLALERGATDNVTVVVVRAVESRLAPWALTGLSGRDR